MVSRRALLAAAGTALAGAALWPLLTRREARRGFGGRIVGGSHAFGHGLLGDPPQRADETRRTGVVIAGGGIAGLAAAWKLRRAGFDDFLLLELEPALGGTSLGGENAVSRFPWAAHYLPLPGPRATAVRELLEEMGAITGWSPSGEPLWEERWLCHAPEERLFLHGRWQDGLVPVLGAAAEDLRQIEDFRSSVSRLGAGGGFAIPVEASSREPELLALDRLSMADWMAGRGWTSPRLLWWIDYCCRDDFGCTLAETSAWVGVHYFAGREQEGLLTWPEGNARLVVELSKGLGDRVRTGVLAHRVAHTRAGVEVSCLEAATGRRLEVTARHAILSVPRFVAARIFPEAAAAAGAFEYAPWLVANLTLDRPPAARPHDAPLSWDNVIYRSPSLGYVTATHQNLGMPRGPTVLTYYHAFAGESPPAARRRMLGTSWEHWCDLILADLRRAHPEIAEIVANIDVMLWGHAMVRPRPGLVWGEARRRAAEPRGAVHFAHSDQSGMALFEEAQYRGVLAAERILRDLGKPFASSLGPLAERA